MKYKANDKVRLKPLSATYLMHEYGVNREMEELFGTIVTVTSSTHNKFRIKEDGGAWVWSPDWVEKSFELPEDLFIL